MTPKGWEEELERMLEITVGSVFTGLSKADFATFKKYMAISLAEIEAGLSEDIYNQILNTLQQAPSPATLAKARDQANKQARQITGNFAKVELEKIGKTIAEGIVAGKDPYAVARMLKMITELDAPRANRLMKYEEYLRSLGLSEDEIQKRLAREKERLIKARRETIARTEMREATSTARELAALQQGARWKFWITVGDDRVSELCMANEDEGPIEIEEPFPSGDMHPPGHPNCRCTVGYFSNPDDAGREWEMVEGKHNKAA